MIIDVTEDKINRLKNLIKDSKKSYKDTRPKIGQTALEVLICGSNPDYQIGRSNTSGYMEGIKEAAEILGVDISET